jgi:hypothetical protein
MRSSIYVVNQFVVTLVSTRNGCFLNAPAYYAPVEKSFCNHFYSGREAIAEIER